jgi:hypothetical protein
MAVIWDQILEKNHTMLSTLRILDLQLLNIQECREILKEIEHTGQLL